MCGLGSCHARVGLGSGSMMLLRTSEFGLQLFKLQKTLDLEILGVYYALPVLVDNINIREEALNDVLEA